MKKVLQFVNSATSDFDAFATNGRNSQKCILGSMKYFKTFLLLIAFVTFMGFNNANAAGGIYDGWLIFKGTTYNLGSQAVVLNGANLGTFVTGGDASITYTEADMFKDANGNNCSAELWYKITGTGSTTYIGSDVNTGAMGYAGYLGGNNNKWNTSSVSYANILAGLSAGTYQIAFWIHGTGSTSNPSSCSESFYYSNFSNNYVATFAIVNSSATDYFRSKNTGSWNTSANWESSPNNSSWGPSTLVPGSSASGITILSGHNITLDGDVTIPRLTINSGGTFTASDATPRTLTISSGGTLTNNGTFTHGSGLVYFLGTGTITGTIGFNDVTISAGAVNFGLASTINGILKITGTGSITTNPPFYAEGSTLLYDKGSNHSRNMEWSATSGAGYPYNVTLTGTLALYMGSSGTTNTERRCAGNLTVGSNCKFNMYSSGTSTGPMQQPVTVSGNVSNSGTINLSSNIGGALKIAGNLNNTATIATNSSSVYFVGNTATTIESGSTIGSVTINKDNSKVSVPIELTVTTLSINTGILEIPVNALVTVTGAVTNSVGVDGLVIKSDPTGSGSFNSSSAVAATVERYIAAWGSATEGWHFISSPVTAQAISPAFTVTTPEEYDFFAYNETDTYSPYEYWYNYKHTDFAGWNGGTTFVPGRGYLVSYKTADTKLFKGTLNGGDVTIPLTYTPSNPNYGWNLVGNPFTSGLNWDAVYVGNDNIYGTAKCLSSSTQGYIDILFEAGSVIPTNNGFMVCATEETTLTIPSDAKDSGGNWYKSSKTSSKFTLTAIDLDGTSAQESNLRIIPDATTGFDRMYDADFMPFYAPQFYSVSADRKYSTNTLPEVTESTTIDFGFVKNGGNNFSITASGIESLPYTPYLTDKKTNIITDLSINSEYTFTSEVGDDPNRFILSFLNPTGTSKPTSAQIKVYSTSGKINITGVDGKADVIVRNMLGQVVQRNTLSGSTLQSIDSGKLPSGVYVVSVVSGRQTVSGKVVVK